jgi:hypothetical protein
MQRKWVAIAFFLALALSATAQNNQNPGPQDHPVLKTRPAENQSSQPVTPPDFSSTPAQSASAGPSSSVSPDAIPQGTRFILRLHDPLDTHNLEQGQHFEAELTQDLVSPSGLSIPKGELVRAHVATFERGYTGARLMLAMDDIETPQGWVPLIATFTGIPGDPSIKSTGQEGEITQKGPDKKRVITNAAIGAGIGAATGAAAGGGKGALTGLVAGAGLGTASSFIFKTADLKLDKGTYFEVRLDRDLVVPAGNSH